MHKGTLVKRILTSFVENKGIGEERRTRTNMYKNAIMNVLLCVLTQMN